MNFTTKTLVFSYLQGRLYCVFHSCVGYFHVKILIFVCKLYGEISAHPHYWKEATFTCRPYSWRHINDEISKVFGAKRIFETFLIILKICLIHVVCLNVHNPYQYTYVRKNPVISYKDLNIV